MSDYTPNMIVAFSAFQTAAKMRVRGSSDRKIMKRLCELGFTADAATGVLGGVEEFLSKTGGSARMEGPPRVFISHSHSDRDDAAYLQKVLEKNDVQTFLDQHVIVPGQDLKDRLGKGLLWCDNLLLLWSRRARSSEYVEWEWRHARRLKKDMVPYALDDTPLPSKLSQLVYVDSTDKKHGHAGLLRAIRGRGWSVQDTATLFPGLWRAELSLMGFGNATYDLELRSNGQIVGTGQIETSGLLGSLAQDIGMAGVLGMKLPINGTWSYDDREGVLTLDITASLMGQTNRDVVEIRTTGTETGWLQGQTLGGMPWRLRRMR